MPRVRKRTPAKEQSTTNYYDEGRIMAITCEKCNGPVYDNTFTKRNPKAPDLKCRNVQGCGWVKWLTDTEKNALQAQKPQNTNGTEARAGAVRTHPIILDSLMKSCITAAQTIAKEQFKDGEGV